jgi:hypothetical protein
VNDCAAAASWRGQNCPRGPLGKAYDPKDAIWVLSVLADFGIRRDDPRVAAVAERLFAARADDGGFHPNEKALPGHELEGEPSCRSGR